MKALFIIFLVSFLTIQSFAEIKEVNQLNTCIAMVHEDSRGISKDKILFVFDIDNTLLALNQNFGSVQWFKWQKSLIKEGMDENRVDTNILGLLEKQSWIFQMSQMHTPEVATAEVVTKLQLANYQVIYHTARGPEMRGFTERELRRNGLLPLTTAIGPNKGYPGNYMALPGSLQQREVSYQNGIYMTAGQDKGKWLSSLLNKTQKKINHIVFIDDDIKNLVNVEREFVGSVPATLCRYNKLDEEVRDFNLSEKRKEITLWQKLKDVHKSLLSLNSII